MPPSPEQCESFLKKEWNLTGIEIVRPWLRVQESQRTFRACGGQEPLQMLGSQKH